MTQAQLVTDLTNDVVLAAFFGAVFFVVTYTAMARWWRHAIGITLVMLDAGLILTLAPSVLHRLFGLNIAVNIVFAWYYLSSVALVGVAVWWRSLVMLAINWRGRQDKRTERTP